ncbi:vasodilator-stimulated phosphoprotein-like [Paramacrobiotus metropolitanus]|uniref:vasodilator-stimulated phosphoprotein-like n=1 Tax=Paramacrobiotus metropolitanus TaxID=2943436 RepID=UPI002445B589|nr:vasodilator-stimulated phosphoprotein-like [Paramacrobiotus metropolitanus]
MSNMEKVLATTHATVMAYDDAVRRWLPAGSACPNATAKVQIYQHKLNYTFRLFGRRLWDHAVVLLDDDMGDKLEYTQTTPTFHQWRSSANRNALQFANKDDAEAFAKAITRAVEMRKAASQSRAQKSSPYGSEVSPIPQAAGGSKPQPGTLKNKVLLATPSPSPEAAHRRSQADTISSASSSPRLAATASTHASRATEHQSSRRRYLLESLSLYSATPRSSNRQRRVIPSPAVPYSSSESEDDKGSDSTSSAEDGVPIRPAGSKIRKRSERCAGVPVVKKTVKMKRGSREGVAQRWERRWKRDGKKLFLCPYCGAQGQSELGWTRAQPESSGECTGAVRCPM